MLNFGLSGLRLVERVGHLGAEARLRARGAAAVLERAQAFATVREACEGVTLTVAATVSNRFTSAAAAERGFGFRDPAGQGQRQGQRQGRGQQKGRAGPLDCDGVGAAASGAPAGRSGKEEQAEEADEEAGGTASSAVAAALAHVLRLRSHSPRSRAEAMREVAARNQRTAFVLGSEGAAPAGRSR